MMEIICRYACVSADFVTTILSVVILLTFSRLLQPVHRCLDQEEKLVDIFAMWGKYQVICCFVMLFLVDVKGTKFS